MFKNKPFTPKEAAQYVAGFLAAFDLAGAPMARAIEATEVLMDFFQMPCTDSVDRRCSHGHQPDESCYACDAARELAKRE